MQNNSKGRKMEQVGSYVWRINSEFQEEFTFIGVKIMTVDIKHKGALTHFQISKASSS